LTEYIENRELKLPGGQSDVTIEIDEKNHVIVVNNKYFNKVDAYPIIENMTKFKEPLDILYKVNVDHLFMW
jgi:hypothetical protein